MPVVHPGAADHPQRLLLLRVLQEPRGADEEPQGRRQ